MPGSGRWYSGSPQAFQRRPCRPSPAAASRPATRPRFPARDAEPRAASPVWAPAALPSSGCPAETADRVRLAVATTRPVEDGDHLPLISCPCFRRLVPLVVVSAEFRPSRDRVERQAFHQRLCLQQPPVLDARSCIEHSVFQASLAARSAHNRRQLSTDDSQSSGDAGQRLVVRSPHEEHVAQPYSSTSQRVPSPVQTMISLYSGRGSRTSFAEATSGFGRARPFYTDRVSVGGPCLDC